VRSVMEVVRNAGYQGLCLAATKEGKGGAVPLPVAGFPARVQIPSIKVDAAILPMGLTDKDAMDAPEGPAETGWFELGPRPGEIGSAVIDGHMGWRHDIPAVFDDLYKLRAGDKVYVITDKGETFAFSIREMRTYDADERVPEVWNKNDGQYLNLITCAGDWNKVTKTHDKRLVVFTNLLPEI